MAKQKTGIQRIMLLFFAATILVFGGIEGTELWIKKAGICLKPAAAFPVATLKNIYWQDSASAVDWKGLSAEEISFTLASAALFHSFNPMYNPALLRAYYARADVYKPGGEVYLKKVEDTVESVAYIYKRIFMGGTLNSMLVEGKFPLLKVNVPNSAAKQWVMVLGADRDDFIVLDPLAKSKKLSRLSDYNKVYSCVIYYRLDLKK